MNGLMTEREWRRLAARKSKARPEWWGAQYLLSVPKEKSLRQDQAFRAFLLMLSLVIAVMLPVFVPEKASENFQDVCCSAPEAAAPRKVNDVCYLPPSGLPYRSQTYTREQLLRGKLLLLDSDHPLPADAPAPNTFRIASYGSGMVPVRDLNAKSGRETIHALSQLFAALRVQGVNGLTVWQGTASAAQQRDAQLAAMRRLMKSCHVDEAYQRMADERASSALWEMQQEYTVELRFRTADSGTPDARKLSDGREGQILLQTAWRYGFVRTHPEEAGNAAFCFRYVGKAHAMAMTYLDLSFADYLDWLHHKGTITISEGGRPKYLILCKPMSGTHIAFSIPENASCEVSLDNLGYAVAACTLQ